jgi:hypothetical protein
VKPPRTPAASTDKVDPRREAVVGVVEVVRRQSCLAEIIGAGGSVGCFPNLLHGWEQQADEDGDDRDHDKQFEEREGGAISRPHEYLPHFGL